MVKKTTAMTGSAHRGCDPVREKGRPRVSTVFKIPVKTHRPWVLQGGPLLFDRGPDNVLKLLYNPDFIGTEFKH